MSIPEHVKIVEVGPRDGLQNEAQAISVADKVELIHRLAEAGVRVIESGAFVSPKWVPQMANTGDVFQQIEKREGVTYSALVPNGKGMEAAIDVNVQEVAVFAAASESFSQKNINCSIQDSFDRFLPVLEQAGKHNIKVRGYVSCVLGCPYEGAVDPSAVLEVSKTLFEMGCYEISLGDTIGVGTPIKARQLVEALQKEIPNEALAVHFHDTYGQALANIYACLEAGIQVVDSAVGGLGGCPYAQGASGNVATEDVLYMLEGMGIETGIDLQKMIHTAQWIFQKLNKTPQSKIARISPASETD